MKEEALQYKNFHFAWTPCVTRLYVQLLVKEEGLQYKNFLFLWTPFVTRLYVQLLVKEEVLQYKNFHFFELYVLPDYIRSTFSEGGGTTVQKLPISLNSMCYQTIYRTIYVQLLVKEAGLRYQSAHPPPEKTRQVNIAPIFTLVSLSHLNYLYIDYQSNSNFGTLSLCFDIFLWINKFQQDSHIPCPRVLKPRTFDRARIMLHPEKLISPQAKLKNKLWCNI